MTNNYTFQQIVKYLAVVTFLLLLTVNLPAQLFDDLEDESTDIIQGRVRGEQKSAAKAVIMSSIFPGSGHIYAKPKSVGTFLFPVLEIAFWAGLFYFDKQGSDIERDYLAFADKHYYRSYFYEVRDVLIEHSQSSNIYNNEHFRLDPANTQHFYEDIGKYNKYIFGWEDWYEMYVHPETKEIRWEFNSEGLWLGNYVWNQETGTYQRPYSALRADYIKMRRDAQENFNKRDLMGFGLALNRIASSIDATRITKQYNRDLRYSYNINFKFSPIYVDNTLTPTLNMVINY